MILTESKPHNVNAFYVSITKNGVRRDGKPGGYSKGTIAITANVLSAYNINIIFQTTLKGAKNRRFRVENGGFDGASDLTRTGDLLITSGGFAVF